MKSVLKLRPVVIIDTREQRPLEITAFPVEIEKLSVGDYSIRGFHDWNNPGIAIERKSIDDLVSTLTNGRERFLREVEGLRRFQFAAVLIEGDRTDVEQQKYFSKIKPEPILAALDAIMVRAGIHVIWASNPTFAAARIEQVFFHYLRGFTKPLNQLTPANTLIDIARD